MMASLDRGWRLLATALSFILFGVSGVLLGLLVMPLLWIFLRKKSARAATARWLISRGFRLFVFTMAILGVLRFRLRGFEAIGDTPAKRRARLSGCLVVANHPSLIDVVFLLAWFPEAVCVVKGAHWSNPVLMGSIRTAAYISNNNPTTLLASAAQHLMDGEHVLMFPEGTRTVPGQPLDLRRGAATIAVNAGARVLPVTIRCTPTTLTKAEPWYHIPRRRVLLELEVLPMISCEQVHPPGLNPRQAAIGLTQQLTTLFDQHLER